MFLLWLGIFAMCCIAEEISDNIKANKYKKNGGLYTEYPCFKPKPWVQEWIDKCEEEERRRTR